MASRGLVPDPFLAGGSDEPGSADDRHRQDGPGLTQTMPLTPFHLAPALAAKSLWPRWTGLLPFASVQVVMDVEPALRLALGIWPPHGLLHSAAGGILAGLISAAAARRISRASSWRVALTSGVLGGLSHVVLDAIVHPDVMPFWPWSSVNPLFVAGSFWLMHWALAALTLLALLGLTARGRRRTDAGRKALVV